ncbi:3'-5' exonuclease, partial [Gordonia jinhuaensis]|uniref:3'-5' exonuclease n=1 Tax=Gordonia jinhuaensis TaxID=1517702 RepID=UPI001E34CCBF
RPTTDSPPPSSPYSGPRPTNLKPHSDWTIEWVPLTRSEQLDMLGLRPEDLRVLISTIRDASQDWTDKSKCAEDVRKLVRHFADGLPLSLHPQFTRRTVVNDKLWNFWTSRIGGMITVTDADPVRWTHIHGVKGDEFDAVVLAISDPVRGQPHVLDDWHNGRNSELRRVLYVGASRARKVLILVIPPNRLDQLTHLLSTSGVKHEVTVAM